MGQNLYMIRALFLILLAGCHAPEAPTRPATVEEARTAVTRLKNINTATWPDVRTPSGHGLIRISKDTLLVRLGRTFRDDAEVGMNGELMWFWLRPYDPDFAYSYRNEDLPLINDILRPDIIRAALGLEAEAELWHLDNGLVVASSRGIDHERVIFMDSEKIVAQEFRRNGTLMIRIDVLEHNDKNGIFLPGRILVRVPEENFEREIELGDVEVNTRIEKPEPSRPTKNLRRTF